MPKRGEKARKIALLKAGKGVKAPKGYWDIMAKEAKKEYPHLSARRRAEVVGARWRGISRAKKIEKIKKYQR